MKYLSHLGLSILLEGIGGLLLGIFMLLGTFVEFLGEIAPSLCMDTIDNLVQVV